MKKSLLLISLIFVASCGDKHTFDKPFKKTGFDNNVVNVESIPKIEVHKNIAHYYGQEFNDKFIVKLNALDSISNEDKEKLRDDLNAVLRKDHSRVFGKFDTIEKKGCTKEQGQTNTCYGHNQFTYDNYKNARILLFGFVDLNKTEAGVYSLPTLYCNQDFTTEDLDNPNFPIGVNRIPDNNTLNAEHVWPRSWMPGYNDEKDIYYRLKMSDIHNLYSSFAKSNSLRSNHSFDNYDASTDTVENEINDLCAKSQAKVFSRDGKTYFEPPKEVKGDIARIMFYMAVRHYFYKMPEEMRISPRLESVLRKWHQEDPVTKEELERNNRIFQVQHNRNPFIDYPQLVELISDF